MIGTQHFLLFLIELWLEVPLVHAVEHKSCDILGAQLLRQILSPLLRRQPPVLIAVIKRDPIGFRYRQVRSFIL